jgi:hypothetical protein
MTCSTRFMFSGVNWKGIFGLFSALSRCCIHSARQNHPSGREPYDKDCIAAPLRRGMQQPDTALRFGQLPERRGKQPPSKQRCHRAWLCPGADARREPRNRCCGQGSVRISGLLIARRQINAGKVPTRLCRRVATIMSRGCTPPGALNPNLP